MGIQSPVGKLTQIKCHFLGKADRKQTFVPTLKSPKTDGKDRREWGVGGASRAADMSPAADTQVSSEGKWEWDVWGRGVKICPEDRGKTETGKKHIVLMNTNKKDATPLGN